MMRSTGVMTLTLGLLSACGAPQAARGTLEGAWEVVGLENAAGASGTGGVRAQPGQFIFTGSRYAAVWVAQADPRAHSATHFEPTTEEALAHYQSVVANSGTYDVFGSRVTIRPIVAKVPEFAAGFLTYEYRLEGDRLVLEAVEERSASGVAPPWFQTTRERLTLRRVE